MPLGSPVKSRVSLAQWLKFRSSILKASGYSYVGMVGPWAPVWKDLGENRGVVFRRKGLGHRAVWGRQEGLGMHKTWVSEVWASEFWV